MSQFLNELKFGVVRADKIYVDDVDILEEQRQQVLVNKRIVFNNNGAFSSDASLTFDSDVGSLNVNAVKPVSGFPLTLGSEATGGNTTCVAASSATDTQGGNILVRARETAESPSTVLTLTGATGTKGGDCVAYFGTTNNSGGFNFTLGGATATASGGVQVTLENGSALIKTGLANDDGLTMRKAGNINITGGYGGNTASGGDVNLTGSTSVTFRATTSGGTTKNIYLQSGPTTYKWHNFGSIAEDPRSSPDTTTVNTCALMINSGAGTTAATLKLTRMAQTTGDELTFVDGVTPASNVTYRLGVLPVTRIADGALTDAKMQDSLFVTASRLANTTVTAGMYYNCSVTVNDQGLLTAASTVVPTARQYIGCTRSTTYAVALNAYFLFDAPILSSGITYVAGTGIFTLTTNKLYKAIFNFTYSATNFIFMNWTNTSTLATLGGHGSHMYGSAYAVANSPISNSTTLISTAGGTNLTVGVRCTGKIGGTTIAYGAIAIIYELG